MDPMGKRAVHKRLNKENAASPRNESLFDSETTFLSRRQLPQSVKEAAQPVEHIMGLLIRNEVIPRRLLADYNRHNPNNHNHRYQQDFKQDQSHIRTYPSLYQAHIGEEPTSITHSNLSTSAPQRQHRSPSTINPAHAPILRYTIVETYTLTIMKAENHGTPHPPSLPPKLRRPWTRRRLPYPRD